MFDIDFKLYRKKFKCIISFSNALKIDFYFLEVKVFDFTFLFKKMIMDLKVFFTVYSIYEVIKIDFGIFV